MSDNELIAEFMGLVMKQKADAVNYPKGKHDWEVILPGRFEGIGFGTKEDILRLPRFAMQYHTSWDWLMPVVEKIQGMKKEVHELTWDSHFEMIDRKCTFYRFSYISEVSTIDAVWTVVVEFIKWYNSTSDTNK